MMMEWNIRIVGCLMLIIACLHAFFPRWFHWREELPRLSTLNRQIFVVHTLFIVLILVMFGLLFLIHARTMLSAGELGRLVFFGVGVFWATRFVVQTCYYHPSLWRGSSARTAIHVLVTILCLYLAAVCFWGGIATADRTIAQ